MKVGGAEALEGDVCAGRGVDRGCRAAGIACARDVGCEEAEAEEAVVLDGAGEVVGGHVEAPLEDGTAARQRAVARITEGCVEFLQACGRGIVRPKGHADVKCKW